MASKRTYDPSLRGEKGRTALLCFLLSKRGSRVLVIIIRAGKKKCRGNRGGRGPGFKPSNRYFGKGARRAERETR